MMERNDYHYLPVDDRAAEWGFYLTTTGRVLDPVAWNRPHGIHPDMYMFDQSSAPSGDLFKSSSRESGRVLPEFKAILITDTHAIFESEETGVIEFDGPTLLFLFPGVWHRYRPVGTDKEWITSRWIGFNGDAAYRLMGQQFITAETACRPVVNPMQLVAAFDRLIDRVAANTAGDLTLLSLRAMDLLADCIESAQSKLEIKNPQDASILNPSEENDDREALTVRILDLIWTGSHRDLTTDQLCESVGVKRRNMERWFMVARGHSLRAEVNLCRCRRARHFLETTDLPIKNICWLAGFRNTDQMRMNFLNLVGVLPDQYRQSYRRER
jgi:AraC-like DNA-binding protein